MTAREDDPRCDAELVARANAGDAAGFEALYHRYRRWVVGVAFRLTGDHEVALDVMQETFIALLRRFPGFELRCELKTYLYTVARNAAITAGRRARREPRLTNLADRPSPVESEPGTVERRTTLARVVSELGAAHREVLLLRFVDGLRLPEIAEALGLPLGTVKSRLHHALRALRENETTRSYFDP